MTEKNGHLFRQNFSKSTPIPILFKRLHETKQTKNKRLENRPHSDVGVFSAIVFDGTE